MKEAMTWIALKIGDTAAWVATRAYRIVEEAYYRK